MADDASEPRWQRRGGLALTIRAITIVVPFCASVAALIVGGRLVPRPSGVALLGWYVGLFALTWVVLWLVRRLLHRLLPLAALLELTLSFPESAPSRLTLAKRSASTRDLSALLEGSPEAPRQETTQQAAERILTLMAALARHDRHTRGHAERVRAYTDLIAGRVGLPRRDRDRLQWAALLHDIGKLAVPAALLNKPAKPNPREWELLKGHPEAGRRIVTPLMEWLGEWGDVIVQHHEQYNGSGYPLGLAGHGICRGARIVAVADSLEVMTAARPYKRPIRKEAAMRELVRCSGTQFDPDVIRALLAIPGRRLMLAMGPSAWLAGLPFIGQAPAQLVANVVSQTTASAGVAAVVVTSVHPAGLAGLAAKPSQVPASPPAAVLSSLPHSSTPVSHTASSGGASRTDSRTSSAQTASEPSTTLSSAAASPPTALPTLSGPTQAQHHISPMKPTQQPKQPPKPTPPAAASKTKAAPTHPHPPTASKGKPTPPASKSPPTHPALASNDDAKPNANKEGHGASQRHGDDQQNNGPQNNDHQSNGKGGKP
ncbi:MAG: HD domain-containing phosphohydrolase [Acidothermaceae bacterium]